MLSQRERTRQVRKFEVRGSRDVVLSQNGSSPDAFGLIRIPPALDPESSYPKLIAKPRTLPLASASIVVTILIGWLDYATGPDINLSLLYLLPVAAAAWFGSRELGFITALASAAAWFTAGIPEGAQVSHPVIHSWNATSRLLIYALIAYLFSSLRRQRNKLEQAVEQKTALLQEEIALRARAEREVLDVCAHEQRRIAYDLHDNIGGLLIGIALRVKLLAEKLRDVRPLEAQETTDIVRLINEAAKQTRLTARNLDGADEVGDLRAALQKLAADVRKNCRVRGSMKANSAALPVSTPMAVHLYRIAQEAVRNAIEHGGAKTVEIDLASDSKEIVLVVRDNGRGFIGDNSEGMGLRIMQFRAHSIGGSCHIRSSRPRGTTVTCRIPLPIPAA
jgi:signal transduction histidine kinase